MQRESSNTSYAWFWLVIGLLAAWFLRMILFFVFDRTFDSQLIRSLLSVGYRFLIFVLPVFWYLRRHHEPALEFLKITTSPSRGFVVSGIILCIGVAIQIFTIVMNIDSLPQENGLGILDKVVVTAFFEEILFRGFILHQLQKTLSFSRANIYTSLLFLPFHWITWSMVGWGSIEMIFIRSLLLFFLVSIPLGLLVKKSNSIWPAVFFHLMVNFINQS